MNFVVLQRTVTVASPFLAAVRAGRLWICARIDAWRRRSRDRAALSRMSMRQLDDLPLQWPDDLRHIRRS